MRRIIFYGIPVIAFIIFFIIMNGGVYMKNTIGEKDHHFTKFHKELVTNIKDGEWEQAIENAEKLETVWKKKIPRIQFSVERDQINGIDISLARLNGYLEAKDEAGSLAELYEAKRHWDDLGH